jgi:hypothetical protein
VLHRSRFEQNTYRLQIRGVIAYLIRSVMSEYVVFHSTWHISEMRMVDVFHSKATRQSLRISGELIKYGLFHALTTTYFLCSHFRTIYFTHLTLRTSCVLTSACFISRITDCVFLVISISHDLFHAPLTGCFW